MTLTEVGKSKSVYDVVIVGAGIIGLSIAWQIARRSKLRIAVLERGVGVGEGSTGSSSAVCRFRYSLDEVVELARDGIAAYQDWRCYTGLSRTRAEYRNDGVLWIPGSDTDWAFTQHRRMKSLGINTEVLSVEDVKRRFPSISTCGLSPDLESGEFHDCGGDQNFFFEVDGGYMDPVSAAQDLVDACRSYGVDVRFNSFVDDIEKTGGCVSGISMRDGERLESQLVINAAGPWCKEICDLAALSLPWDINPVRIQVIHRDRPPELTGHVPITVDMPGGIYFRTQNRGQQLIVSSVLEEDEREVVLNPDEFMRETDPSFEMAKLHALHHRLPALKYQGRVMGYSGLYTVNHDDVHPIVGPTVVEGFWVANGFSGHGFKLAPAIGSMIAQTLTGVNKDFDTQVPLDFLSVNRRAFDLNSKSVLA